MITSARMLVALAALASPWQARSVAQDAVPTARAFLETFLSNPQLTRGLVTRDALFVFVDMGGPYADLLKGLGDKKPALSLCSLVSLKQTGTPTLADVKGFPADSLKTPGHFATVEATYSCKRPNARTGFVDVRMLFKDNLLAMLSWGPRREN